MKLSPLKTFKKTTNTLLCFHEDGAKYVVKCYKGVDNFKRCCREKNAIEHWTAAGFNVPQIHDRTVPEVEEPYLIFSFIEGVPLREYLSTGTHTAEEKLRTMEKLFDEMSSRHKIAAESKDRYLVHYDLNSGNVICSGDRFCYVDFEAKPKFRTVNEAAGAELLALCRWAVRDMGIEFNESVMKLAVASYKDQRLLLDHMVRRTSGRLFQFYHRWKDRKHKTANPNDVTKYDIADTVEKLRREA